MSSNNNGPAYISLSDILGPPSPAPDAAPTEDIKPPREPMAPSEAEEKAETIKKALLGIAECMRRGPESLQDEHMARRGEITMLAAPFLERLKQRKLKAGPAGSVSREIEALEQIRFFGFMLETTAQIYGVQDPTLLLIAADVAESVQHNLAAIRAMGTELV